MRGSIGRPERTKEQRETLGVLKSRKHTRCPLDNRGIRTKNMNLSSIGYRSIDDIGFYTISEKRAERVVELYRRQDPLAFKIARAEVVLGSQCNLQCRFCKGLPSNGESRLSETYLRSIFEEWMPGGAQYVHITGGEPTLWPDIRKLVETVTEVGAVACMTSNGAAPFSLYRDLVERGLRDIRISLHAHNPGLYEWITGVDSIFENVGENIRQLVYLRDRFFPDLYVMINTCVLKETIQEFPSLLRFLMAFNPNDIKPVAIVQWTGHRLEAARKYYDQEILPKLLEITPQDTFPILRYRLPTLLTKRLRGFPGKSNDGGLEATPNCFLMLDDRCIDSEWYYPCNIYLRERGAPLGSHYEDDFKTVAGRVWDFVHQHDIRKDPICCSCCPDVVREYNLYIAKLLQDGKKVEATERRIIC